ncbi:unnamed protein product [Caenorhabditis angaria]|uniref:Uncharacterized protein n=1 Tax=Caenorhabditis angaria TaxID=860376 RepID=A0A9P1IY14_9PELO|nr:unnamed protein product [Caenorhabditis angaria]
MNLLNRKNDLNADKPSSSASTKKRAGRPKNSLAKPKKVEKKIEVASVGTRNRKTTRRYSPSLSSEKKIEQEEQREIHNSFKNIGKVVKEISKRLEKRDFECPQFPGIVPTAHKKMMKAQAEKAKLEGSQPKPVSKKVVETPNKSKPAGSQRKLVSKQVVETLKRSERARRPPKKLIDT